MADSKITALTSIGASTDPANDPLVLVDVSDTSMAATGTTKKVTLNQLLGASGTATLASATITGAATVGTTLDVTGQLSTANVVKATGNPGLSSAGATEAFVAHNTTYGAVLYGQGTTYDAALLDRNTFSRLTVTTAGAQVSGDLSMTSGNVVMATSGKGIDFSATAGTGTSELLNDYEEGTFTPTIAGSSSTGTGTYSVQTARYTKVGRLVTCEINITWSAHTGTGNLWISGLPFTPTSSVDGSVFCGILNNVALSAGYVATGYVASSVSSIVMHQYPTGGGASIPVPIDTAGAITVSAIYTV